MYNPLGADQNKEFIEIYHSPWQNLTNYTISDGNTNESLIPIHINTSSNFSLIIESDSVLSLPNCSIYITDTTIGSGGLNNNETISLYHNSTIDSVKINSSIANNNGYSMEYYKKEFHESQIINGTPGKINSANTTQNITATNDQCNISISLATNKEIFNKTIEFYNLISSYQHNFTIEYWVEDLFGNVLKQKINTTNMNKKSYTPSFSEEDKAFIIKNRLAQTGCNNTSNTTSSSKPTIVKGEQIKTNTSSKITIENIYLGSDDAAKFGENIKVKITVYRGNTKKTAIEGYLEKNRDKVSKITNANIYTSYQDITFTIPIQIKPNCNNKFPDGIYTLTVSGLDTIEKKSIILKDNLISLCPTIPSITQKKETISQPYKQAAENIHFIPPNIPKTLFSNRINSTIQIINNKSTNHSITIYSYVYRSSKSYSGDREQNKKIIPIKKKSTTNITLANYINISTNGIYSYKIRIYEDSKKTPTEFTYRILINLTKNTSQHIETNITNTSTVQRSLIMPEITGKTVQAIYEPKNSSNSTIGLYVLFGAIITITFFFILKTRLHSQKI